MAAENVLDLTGQCSLASADTVVRHEMRRRAGLPDPMPWVTPRGLRVDYLGWDRASRRSFPPSLSVVVPSWNSENSLMACVSGLAKAAALIRDECAVEIILVDDSSRIPAADVLADLRVPQDIRVIRVEHGGQSRATNTGVRYASGKALVLCDSDIVVNPWSLDQLLRALTLDPGALAFGFRENVAPDDGLLDPGLSIAGDGLPSVLNVADENRFIFHMPGVPTHLFAATRQLRDLSGGRRIYPPGKQSWSLPLMAYGCLLACSRNNFLRIGGFDGRFVRWGFNDTEFCARWIASGGVLIPVFTANGVHAEHKARHPLQWRMAGQSRSLYERTLGERWFRPELSTLPVLADKLIRRRCAIHPPPAVPVLAGVDVARRAAIAADAQLFERAAGARAVDLVADPRLAGHALRVLRLSGDAAYLAVRDISAEMAPQGASFEYGLLEIARGRRAQARAHLAKGSSEGNWRQRGSAQYLLHRPAAGHRRFAMRHFAQAMPRAAASGLLACLAAPDGGRFAGFCTEHLENIAPEDRRIY